MNWTCSIDIQAKLRDTDALGHVNNAVYVTWFEEVRTLYVVTRRGVTSMDDVDFVLASMQIQFRSPVFMLETVEMSCSPTRVGNSSWDLVYEGRVKSDGRVVVEGTSTQVQYDYATRKSMPIADEWRAILQADLVKR